MFEKWKLYERESFFDTVLVYELENVIRLERRYWKTKSENHKMHDLIFELYFEYEWDWKPISNRKIALLLWVDHQTVNNIVNKSLWTMRTQKNKISPEIKICV
jgi:DNA invertase Pin-like site-specific DNA recombinase